MADGILPQCGIYAIVNKVNGKRYIGQSVHIRRRKTHHFYLLKQGTHNCHHLQRAFQKHGAEWFEFSVLEQCEESALTVREQFWMDLYRESGLYNLAPAAGTTKGVRYSDEAKAKISAASKGRKSRLGHRNSPEANAAVAQAMRGRKLSDEAKAKIGAAHAGRKLTPEHIAKMSAALKKVPRTDEWRRRQSEAAKGRKMSPEAIEKMRQARTGMKQDPEFAARRILAASAAKAAKKVAREKQNH